MKLLVVHNPKSGGSSGPDADSLLTEIRRAGHLPTYQSSQEKHWQDSIKEAWDLVVVVGGDGIVSKVGRLLAGGGQLLAVLPTGTANNISRSLGIFDIPLEQLIAGWPKARQQPIDVGAAIGPWGEVLFMEGVGTGIFAWTLWQLEKGHEIIDADKGEEELKQARQLLCDHLQDFSPLDLQISMDGAEMPGSFVLAAAMNMRSIGPNLELAPEADPGDGLLDIVLVHGADRTGLTEYIGGGGLGPPPIGATFCRRKATHLLMHGSAAAFHFDDRVWPEVNKPVVKQTIRVDITIKKHALRFLVPA